MKLWLNYHAACDGREERRSPCWFSAAVAPESCHSNGGKSQNIQWSLREITSRSTSSSLPTWVVGHSASASPQTRKTKLPLKAANFFPFGQFWNEFHCYVGKEAFWELPALGRSSALEPVQNSLCSSVDVSPPRSEGSPPAFTVFSFLRAKFPTPGKTQAPLSGCGGGRQLRPEGFLPYFPVR